jgi:hypothetical protein
MSAAVAPVTEKYKIPMIMAGSASRSLFSKGYSYLYIRFFQQLNSILVARYHLRLKLVKIMVKN